MRAATIPWSTIRHALGVLAEALLIVAIIVTLLTVLAPVLKPAGQYAGTVDARGKTASSVSIRVPDGVFGSTTTGVVTGSGVTWVEVVCILPDGLTGMTSWARPDATGSFSVGLGPTPSWPSGAAACTASAGAYSSNGRWRVLATTAFKVSA